MAAERMGNGATFACRLTSPRWKTWGQRFVVADSRGTEIAHLANGGWSGRLKTVHAGNDRYDVGWLKRFSRLEMRDTTKDSTVAVWRRDEISVVDGGPTVRFHKEGPLSKGGSVIGSDVDGSALVTMRWKAAGWSFLQGRTFDMHLEVDERVLGAGLVPTLAFACHQFAWRPVGGGG